MSTATSRIRADFPGNRLQLSLLLAYSCVWILTAIHPVDPQDWMMENAAVLATACILIGTYRVFPLSDLSYLLLTIFMTIHAVGAHYSYARVPAGFWLQDAFGLSRNHFDRIGHAAFGLLLSYPFREILFRLAKVRGFWSYYLPVDVSLALSGLYEICESWVARIVNPALGEAYLGSQGDVWDAQQDMTAALAGSIACMTITAVLSGRRACRAAVGE